MSTDFEAAVQRLCTSGIGWLAFVPSERGPDPALCEALPEGAGVLLLLSLGSEFTELSLDGAPADPDPVDSRSTVLAKRFAAEALPAHSQLIYPGATPLDLRSWLRGGGVQTASRLGTGIRPDVGPWLAVRAAIATTLEPEQRELIERRFPPLASGGSVCDACVDAPCVRACPAQAVGAVGQFDLDACVRYRLKEHSECADRCLARLSCPVGSQFRYEERALRYHYGVSMRMLRRYKAGQS